VVSISIKSEKRTDIGIELINEPQYLENLQKDNEYTPIENCKSYSKYSIYEIYEIYEIFAILE
jgi:hypothetical protein